MKDEVNDTAVTVKATRALTSDPTTSGASDAIHVQTSDGVVTLIGDVASLAVAENAQTIVADLAGVHDVVNDLKYPRSAQSGESIPRQE